MIEIILVTSPVWFWALFIYPLMEKEQGNDY